jgi:hypothetical protein
MRFLVQKNLPYKLIAETAIFYHDKATCRTADSVQQQLTAIFPSFVPNASMPPNSSDLNVVDYYAGSLLKERLNKYGLILNFRKKIKERMNEEVFHKKRFRKPWTLGYLGSMQRRRPSGGISSKINCISSSLVIFSFFLCLKVFFLG